MHGCSPEVVEEDIEKRRVGPEVPVVLDGTNIVKDEPAVAAVVVAEEACEGHDGPQRLVSHPGARTSRVTALLKLAPGHWHVSKALQRLHEGASTPSDQIDGTKMQGATAAMAAIVRRSVT